MIPFFFGSSDRRLYGLYEPAQPAAAKRAVLLCPTWGSEYLHSHRSMQYLASKLAASGFHTLRFDYFGSGDSAGESNEADIVGWRRDIATALRELKEMSGVGAVSLLGLRLGAALAASVAPSLGGEVGDLVLWEPVFSGEEYLAELMSRGLRTSHFAVASSADCEAGPDAIELEGIAVGPAFLSGLREIDLAADLSALRSRALLLLSHDQRGKPELKAVSQMDTALAIEIEIVESAPVWNAAEETYGVVPVKVLEKILKWLK